MSALHRILEQYWGFTSFRPVQEDVIRAVADDQRDVVALLPTGGGKSLCFQVPAMAREGICLVVSPLIALMQDQVSRLNEKGIKAFNLSGNLKISQLDRILDKCIYDGVKFLYLSPERLETHLVKERIKKMPVNLVAIDEAHCISQWGYDFRPAYLRIAALRDLLGDVPFLALTASANNRVIGDISRQLQLKEPLIFKKSFYRDNLCLFLEFTEKKLEILHKVVLKNRGSGLIYTQSRRETKTIADFLLQQGQQADFYHAGLDSATRARKQQSWISGATRIMVCTNAFGMGIDKSDVRFVIHYGMPASLENYYQEAGRAGRDGNKAFAVALVNKSDETRLLQTVSDNFPPRESIKKMYAALGNLYKIAYGAGENVYFDLQPDQLSKISGIPLRQVYSCLDLLQHQGLIHLTEAFYQPPRVMFLVDNHKLYEFQVFNPVFDPLIKLMLRSYSGMFDDYVKIDENYLAAKLRISHDKLVKMLHHLGQMKVLDYLRAHDHAQVAFATERLRGDNFRISEESYEKRKFILESQVNAILRFMHEAEECRFVSLCSYFDEESTESCGKCDNCLRKAGDSGTMEGIIREIRSELDQRPLSVSQLKSLVKFRLIPGQIEDAVRWMLEHEEVMIGSDQRLRVVS